MSVKLEYTNFYETTKKLVEQRVNSIVLRKLNEFIINLSKVLSEEEVRKANLIQIIEDIKVNRIYINLCTYQIKKPRQKRDVAPDLRCLARTGLSTQCTRSRVEGTEFCKSHSAVLPYGKIDEPVPIKTKIGQRRGRKARKNKKYELEDLDISRYIQASIINIDGNVFIQDENGILYEYNTDNLIIGRVTDSKIIWY